MTSARLAIDAMERVGGRLAILSEDLAKAPVEEGVLEALAKRAGTIEGLLEPLSRDAPQAAEYVETAGQHLGAIQSLLRGASGATTESVLGRVDIAVALDDARAELPEAIDNLGIAQRLAQLDIVHSGAVPRTGEEFVRNAGVLDALLGAAKRDMPASEIASAHDQVLRLIEGAHAIKAEGAVEPLLSSRDALHTLLAAPPISASGFDLRVGEARQWLTEALTQFATRAV